MPSSFLPEHTQLLKRAMIPNAPGCFFADDDVASLGAATGLNAAQVRKWAEHLRSRVKTDDRLEFLQHVPSPDAETKVTLSPPKL